MIKFKSNNPNDILEQLQKEICCLDELIQQIVSGGLGWALTGNVVSPTSFIGSTNLADFVVKTNNIERMRVLSSGLVGVNTSAPTAPLDVNGQIRVRGGAPGAGKVLTSDANGLATWTTITVPTPTITGAESGLHMQGTVARLGGMLLETEAIYSPDPTKKLIFNGEVALNNGDYTDAFTVWTSTGEGPAIGIKSEQDGISIDAAGNGVTITGGVFGINSVGETTGVVAVGNSQNGGDFSGLHGGLNITYGRSSSAGVPSDFGVKINSGASGNVGTPLILNVPQYGGAGTINMINMTQSTNSVVNNGYGQSISFSYGQPGGGSSPQFINQLKSYWQNVGSLTQVFQISSPTPGNLGALQNTFTLYNTGQLQLNRYIGATPFTGAATRVLAVDSTNGSVVTIPIPSGGGSGTVTTGENGLSNSSPTVLTWGQPVGAVGDPAKLLSSRVIPLNGNEIAFTSTQTDFSINPTGLFIENAEGDALTITGSYLGQLNGIKVTNPQANPLSSVGLKLVNDTAKEADIYLGSDTNLNSADALVMKYGRVKIVGTDSIQFNLLDDAATSSQTAAFTKLQNFVLGTTIDGIAKMHVSDTVTGTDNKFGIYLHPTWDTTGIPTALKIEVTDTASAITSKVIDIDVNTNPIFQVDKLGNALIGNQVTIKGGAPGVGKVLTSDVNGLASWGPGLDSIPAILNAYNGLIASGTGVNRAVYWGGPLTAQTLINGTALNQNIEISGIVTSAQNAMLAVSTVGAAGKAISGTTTNGQGVTGIATSGGIGLHGYSTGNGTGIRGDSYTPAIQPGSGIGVYGSSGTGIALYGLANSTGVGVQGVSGSGLAMYLNSSLKVFRINFDNPTAPASGVHIIGSFEKTTSNQVVAGAGFGMAIEYQLASAEGPSVQAGTTVHRWTTAATATRGSAFDLTLFRNGATVTPMSIDGNKTVNFTGVCGFTDNPFGFVRMVNSGDASSTLSVAATGNSATGVNVSATGYAVVGTSTGGIGGGFTSTGGQWGVTASTNQENPLSSYSALKAERFTVANNNVLRVMDIHRSSPSYGAVGMGGAIHFTGQVAANPIIADMASISSKWIDATNGSVDGDFSISTTRAGVPEEKLYIDNLGAVTLNKYASAGPPSFPGSPAFMLGTDTAGKVIQVAPVSPLPQPLKYVALLTAPAVAGGDPTVVELENTIGAIVWAGDGVNAGIFTGTLAGAFTANKTVVFNSGFNDLVGPNRPGVAWDVNSISLHLLACDCSSNSENAMEQFAIEIRVYP